MQPLLVTPLTLLACLAIVTACAVFGAILGKIVDHMESQNSPANRRRRRRRNLSR